MKRWAASLATVTAMTLSAFGLMGGGHAIATVGTTSDAVGLLAYNPSAIADTDVSRYDVVVINADQYDEVPQIRAANPNAEILVYKNVAEANSDMVTDGADNADLPTGVGYEEATTQHPEWFLKDTNGNPVQWADYPGDWWMNVGSTSYQNTWAANVIAEAKANGVNGVLLDDVDMDEDYHLPSGTTLAAYPTDADYQQAMSSFLANVGPQLSGAGLLSVANIAFDWTPNWEPAYKQWVSDVDGVMLEHWIRPGQDSTYARYADSDWTYQQQQATDVEDAGKMFIPLTYGSMDDTVTQTYARASFLTTWTGGDSAQMWVPNTSGQDTWADGWTANVGQPLAAAAELPNGVWERAFTGGLVLVNPSSTQTTTVATGASYVDSTGATVTSVTLAPATAEVLTDSGSSTPTAPVTVGGSPGHGHGHGHPGKAQPGNNSGQHFGRHASRAHARDLHWSKLHQLFRTWKHHPGQRRAPHWRWNRLRRLFHSWKTSGSHHSFTHWRHQHRLQGKHKLQACLVK